MSQLDTLGYSLRELSGVVASLDDSEMDTISNCAPWTVRRLASHALNNQLLWAGLVTGEQLVSPEETMGAVAYDGDLAALRRRRRPPRARVVADGRCACRRRTSPRWASSPAPW